MPKTADERLADKAEDLGFEDEVAPLEDEDEDEDEVAAEGEEDFDPNRGLEMASLDGGGFPQSGEPQTPELTPEQEEAKRKLDNWYVTQVSDYMLVRDYVEGELPHNLDLEYLYYTYQVYLFDIQNGERSLEDVNALVSGEAEVLTPPVLHDDLETDITGLSKLGNWLIDEKPELVQEHLLEGEEFNPDLNCSSPQLPDGSTNATCLAALEAGLEWQNRFDRTIIAAVIDPAGPWGEQVELQPELVIIIKRLILNESQFNPTFVDPSDQATGLGQIQPGTLELLINNGYLPPASEEDPYDLANPDTNIRVTVANIKFMYDNIKAQNEAHKDLGWDQMEDTEILMLAIAFHNSGAGGDFATDNRLKLQKEQLEDLEPSCTDPTKWECLQSMWHQIDDEGNVIKDVFLIQYVNNIFGDINDPPR